MPDAAAAERLESLLEGLNDPQREAVEHPGGPLLVLAGAGSGKTRVLTHRIAWLIHSGSARAGEILAITFTNKAAQEMRERVELLLGHSTRTMWVMTFHAACARILRAEAPRLGYTRQFTIYDQSDSRRLVKRCLDQLGIDTKRFTPAMVQHQISDAKNKLRSPDDLSQLVGSGFEEKIAETYQLYDREIRRMNAMDFDDLLVRTVNVMELFGEVRARYAGAFAQVLVDEYQDTNHAQYRMLELIAGEHRNIACVGDDDQCLVEGTLIALADGSVAPIESVRAGDMVLSSYGGGELRGARVLSAFSSSREQGVRVTLASGRSLVSTPEHVHFAGGPNVLNRLGTKRSLQLVLCGAGEGIHEVRAPSLDALPLRRSADLLDGPPLPFCEARDVRPGMRMFLANGHYDVVTSVEPVASLGRVYDLDVEQTHNFVANGVLTHNSIYGFRGADVRNILEFEDSFPEAKVVRLEQNYRSTQTILSVANAVISHNRGRMGKTLWTDIGEGDLVKIRELDDEHAEARYVLGEVERLVDEGVSRNEIAVFYRTNAQSRVLEDTLVRAEVPYQVVGGTKFYERAEVKDAIAYLNLLANPQDAVAFGRVANSPKRGIGQTSLSRVLNHANTLGISIWEVAQAPASVPGLGTAAIKAIGRFMDTMDNLRQRVEQQVPVGDLLEAVLHETGYLDALEAERTIEAQGRIENLEALVEAAREFDARADEGEDTLDVFLQATSLLSDADTRRDDEGLVTLMTLHNAKGLEYPIVFIIGCEEGVFPHSRSVEEGSLEEERRLCYVGITRAMRDLNMTHARRRNVFGAATVGLASRFLNEIPPDLVDRQGSAMTSWGREPAARPRALSWGGGPAAPPAEFRIGDDVVHAAFGDGVVTGVEADVVVVRFASDGSERKLMAGYAPITKRGT